MYEKLFVEIDIKANLQLHIKSKFKGKKKKEKENGEYGKGQEWVGSVTRESRSSR